MLWYAVIFAFRSTFSIKYFQHAHGLELAAAGAINGYVYLAALVATPFFGWLSDRSGRPRAVARVRRIAPAARDAGDESPRHCRSGSARC